MIGNSWGFPNDKNTVVFNLYICYRDCVVSKEYLSANIIFVTYCDDYDKQP